MSPKKPKFPSQLRYDTISKDWVVIATGRGKRPEKFKKEKRTDNCLPKDKCPFCKIETQETPTLIYNKGKDLEYKKGIIPEQWTTIVIPNKYPAVVPSGQLDEHIEGKLFKTLNAVGFHEVVVTESHTKQIAEFSVSQIKEVMDVYQSRYLSLKDKKFVNYISIFHNHGREAGASICHPHSQILTTPLVDASLNRTLETSQNYFKDTGKCIYCKMNRWEQKTKTRIVFENKSFLVICPFASKVAFEMIVSPKKHLPYFEEATEQEKIDLSEAFHEAMSRLYKGLGDPAYNFYLHTAPCDGEDHTHYHWHWTILPKTTIPAGFEFGTGIEISVVEPEKAAEYLRKQ
ncbi:MAG: galactose-1-phosphate uridylyltransferase [Parcubacteria group bacterium]|nr:galactose-1-phosphate uridylyltransferase [Parcubacteria group bacterium]